MRKGNSRFRFWLLAIFTCAVLLVVYDLRKFPEYRFESHSKIPFSHEKHGENLGLECVKCHPGAERKTRAAMPARADCMDCHNLPLSETPAGKALDEVLPDAPESPFEFESRLPSTVFFPHGIHAKANVSCETCHGTASEIDAGRRPEVRMQDCLKCHRGESGFPEAATECARCHR